MERFDGNCHRLLNKPSGYIQQIVATNPLTYMEKKQKQPRSSWQLIRACALRHSGAMTHVLYYIFKMATKTAQIGMWRIWQKVLMKLVTAPWRIGCVVLGRFLLQVRGQRSQVTGHRSQVIDKDGRRNLNLVIQCCKNTVAVAFLRISCRISLKFVLYRYLFTLGNKRRDVVTKAVSFM